MARHLIIGMGEVGNGLFNVLRGKVVVYTRDKDPLINTLSIDYLHITIPYSDEFNKQVKAYVKLYKPKATIVYSTVPIGTCEKLQVVHSPVEGKHPTLGLSIQNSARWLGSSHEQQLEQTKEFWEKFTPVRALPSADFTEALKLLSTTEYGLNIEFARYKKKIADAIGMDYSATKQWNLDYNNLYKRLGMTWAKKYVLDAPDGPKGGHCIVPNAKLLEKQYPSDFTKIVGEL